MTTDLAILKEQLFSGNPVSRAAAADEIAKIKTPVTDKDWIVTVCDFLWRPVGELGDDMIEMIGLEPTNELPNATIKVKGSCELVGHFQGCQDTMVGVIVETAGIRLAFYVESFDWEFANGAWVGTANCLGIWDILNYLVIWPNYLFPIQAQIPSHAVFYWGLVTVIETMISECAFRIQTGLHEFINNVLSLNLDIRAWFGSLLQNNFKIFEMLKTPIYVVRTDMFKDTSPPVARTVRMETCGAVIKDITTPYGVDVRVDLWLPGDEQPDEWTKTFPDLTLTQPTYVVTVKDRSQIEGPTKTVIDSVIRQAVDVTGSLFGEIAGVIQAIPGMEGQYSSPLLGVNYVPPWAILVAPEQGARGSVEGCKITFSTPKGWQHIVGGRSPRWLNDFLNATFAWMIDAVSILIGFTGIPSNLLDGFINDVFLAFQLIQIYERRNQVGPYHPAIEVFHATTSAPYNLETVFAFINIIWDSGGHVAAQCTFRNGVVYTYGKDIFRGGLASLVYMGGTRLYTDYIKAVMFRVTTTERDVMLQLGDGRIQEAPLVKHQRNLSGIFEAINVLTLSPQSQGFL
jgi:hypothetical protein